MATAVYNSVSTPVSASIAPAGSRLSLFAKRVANAIAASQIRRIERELRRHEALMSDLGRRQDHSPLFLDQSELLPFKL